MAEKLLAAFAADIDLHEEFVCNVGVSLGISFFPQSDTTLDGLVAAADEAMYQSKQAGKNTYTLHRTSDVGCVAYHPSAQSA